MFIDRAVVRVVAGTGGSGASSFARFKYKPKGGPDGGDGGHGGSVYVRGDANLATLLDYRYRTVWKAERAEHGKGKTQTGASSADVYLPVPPGTVVRDADTGEHAGRGAPPGRYDPRGQRRPRRPGQRAVRHAHAPGAARVGAGRGGRGALRRAGAQADRRRGSGRRAQRRQEHAPLGHLGRASQDRRLSLHHPGAKPRRRRPVRAPRVRRRRHPGHHRGRARRARDWACGSSSTWSGRACWRSSSRSTAPIRRPCTTGCATRSRLYSERAGRQAAPRGADQAGPAPTERRRCRQLQAPEAAGMLAVSSAAGTGLEELKEYLWSSSKRPSQRRRRWTASGRGGTRVVDEQRAALRGAGADAGHRPSATARPPPSLSHPNRRLFGAVRIFVLHPGVAAPRPRRRSPPLREVGPRRWSGRSASAGGC